MRKEPILTSTFINEIGRQLEISRLSLSFFSNKVIIACFCVFDNSPRSYEQLRQPVHQEYPKRPYKTLL